jgi:hypothetical protein
MKDEGKSKKDCPTEAWRKERISSADTADGAKRILGPVDIFINKIKPGKQRSG